MAFLADGTYGHCRHSIKEYNRSEDDKNFTDMNHYPLHPISPTACLLQFTLKSRQIYHAGHGMSIPTNWDIKIALNEPHMNSNQWGQAIHLDRQKILFLKMGRINISIQYYS